MKDGQLLKESLEDYSTSQYKVTVSDSEKAKEILSDKMFDYKVVEQSILFEETTVALQTMINILNENELQINKVENYKVGAERRYMELFESELSK